MQRFRGVSVAPGKSLLSAAAFAVLAFSLMFGPVNSTQGRAQSQTQTAAAPTPDYKYEIVSIKPSKSNNGRWQLPPDGFSAIGVTPQALIQSAFRIPAFRTTGDYGPSGAPGWIKSEWFDVEAKMDPDVADALKKLSDDDRLIARQRMLQAVLADRFGLVFHRETRELPIYTLIIAKNGSKLHEAKPGDTYPNGIKLQNGAPGAGVWTMMSLAGGSNLITAQAIALSSLLPSLAYPLGRPIVDKTGLTGKYDFTLTYSLDQNPSPSASAPNGQPALASADPTAPSLFTALQEQLGLKLESGKGPIEIIVIDHIERPSGN
jgi:bla regulator protein blaR1